MSNSTVTATLLKSITTAIAGSAAWPATAAPGATIALPQFIASALASGSGADQIQFAYAAQFNLAASGSTTLLLNALGGALDAGGNAYNITKLKYLGVKIQGNAQYYFI